MLRILHQEDLPQLLLIEQLTQVDPWTAEVFERCWKAGYKSWVIEENTQVVGFVMLSYHADECHILNICVHPEFQRRGFGRQLMLHALDFARQHAVGMCFLEVRRSNQHAIALYEKLGFVRIGERKNYYIAGQEREDALVLAKDLSV